MKTTRLLFLTLCLSLSVSILEAQQIFPYPADSSGKLIGKYLPNNPNSKYEVFKKQGAAKLLDSVDYFTYNIYFDSISGRYKPKFELQKTDKYNEYGNLQEVYYYSYKQQIRSRRVLEIVTRDPEERIIQRSRFSDSCCAATSYYSYDTDGNLINIIGYSSSSNNQCLDTTQKPFNIDEYEYTYNNIGKKKSETYYNNMLGYVRPYSHYEYKYANDSVLDLIYYWDGYSQSQKKFLNFYKTQMVYDSSGLLKQEIYFNHLCNQILLDSLWCQEHYATYIYTFTEKGQIESMQRFNYPDYIDRKYTYYPSGVIDSIVELNFSNNITSKYNEDGNIKYIDQIANNSSRMRQRWEYHYVGDVVISGIDEKSENNKLILYPNPAVHQITIDLNPKEAENLVRITEILNLSGQTVWTDNSSYLHKTIDLSTLMPGTYFIRLTTSNGIISKKLFKM